VFRNFSNASESHPIRQRDERGDAGPVQITTAGGVYSSRPDESRQLGLK
jgi:hypothetical protein